MTMSTFYLIDPTNNYSFQDEMKMKLWNLLSRAPISMGDAGASAPMLFKDLGASIHTFWPFFLTLTDSKKESR